MDLEPLNPEPLEPEVGPSGTDEPPAAAPRRRRTGIAVAGTVAGLALLGLGFLLGRTSGGSATTRTVDAANAAALQAADNPALCGPATRRNIAAGKVATVASDGSSFTLTTPRRGSLKVTTSKSTTFLMTTTGAVADATPGLHVRVQGTKGTDGTIAAMHIAIGPPSTAGSATPSSPIPMGRGMGGGGVVKSNDNGTLTITEPNGTTVKVTTTSSTVVVKTVTASMSDVKPGVMVLAQGTQAGDGSLSAVHVDIIGSGVQSGFFGGFPGGGPGGMFRFGRRGMGGGPNGPASPGGAPLGDGPAPSAGASLNGGSAPTA